MVKMATGVVIFCVALLLVLPSVSAVQRLHTINDLANVPKQAVVLLHWFADTVDINEDFIFLTFDPNSDFGSHHYGNFERILNNLPSNRYHYYTVGNVHIDTQQQLPSHIRYPRTPDLRGNRARIVFRVHEQNVGWQGNRQVIDEVYITQHHGQGTEYDPQHTYQITTNLLRQIGHFPMRGDNNSLRDLRDLYGPNVDDYQLQNIQHQWNDLACLGLLLLIVLPRSIHFYNQSLNVPGSSRFQSDRARSQTDSSDLCDCITNCLKLVFGILLVLIIIIFGFSVSMNK